MGILNNYKEKRSFDGKTFHREGIKQSKTQAKKLGQDWEKHRVVEVSAGFLVYVRGSRKS